MAGEDLSDRQNGRSGRFVKWKWSGVSVVMNSDPKGWDKQRKDHAASHSHRFTLVLDLTAGTSKPATPGQPPRNQPADFCEQGLLAGSVSSD